MRCRATVLQRGDTFTRGREQHCHLGDPKLPILRKVSTKVKTLCLQECVNTKLIANCCYKKNVFCFCNEWHFFFLKAKELIKNQQCASARDIVKNAASDVLQGGDEPCLLVSQTSNLIRAVNRHRALHRPSPATSVWSRYLENIYFFPFKSYV